MRLIFTSFFIIIFLFAVDSTSAIHPIVRNYTKKVSNSASQNWCITQNENDWMYFANNNGLLEYDGDSWNIYPIKNYTNVRSVFYDNNLKRIYVGAFNEFGFFETNSFGAMTYYSLVDLLDEKQRVFTEIWNIVQIGSVVFFQGDHVLFRYENKKITSFNFEEKIHNINVVYNTLIL